MTKYIILTLVIGFLCSCGLRKDQFVAKPNILVILTDDQQYDAAGFNGNTAIQTPAIDRLASQSMRFRNSNVVFSLCSPSRAAILTGRYGSANGVLELNSRLNPGEKTVAQYLKEAGYVTGISGKWHLPTPPDKIGFDFHNYFYANGTYYGRKINDMGETVYPEIHCDAYCAKRSMEFMEEQVVRERPFFLFHCTQTPHMDHQHTWPAREKTKKQYDITHMPVPENYRDDLSGKPEYLKSVRNRTQALKYGYPDSAAIQKHTLEYYAVITEMDGFIDDLLQKIADLEIEENTFVFFLSDNGWMLGDHGFTSKVLPYKPSTAVPFTVRGPGIDPGEHEALVSNIDIAPTILNLVGLEIPSDIHGKSMMPLLFNTRSDLREALIYEGLGVYGGAKPNLSLLTEEYRYIVTYEDSDLEKVLFQELYNYKNDPLEMKNLSGDPDFGDVKEELSTFIQEHREEILQLKK